MVAFVLEPLRPEDFDFRWEVYVAAIKPYLDTIIDLSEEQHRQMLQDNMAAGNHAAIVVDDIWVGVLQVEEAPDAIHLAQLELLPAFQGRGIGTAVVRSLQEQAVSAGMAVRLEVFHANTGARRMYERLGFREVEATDRNVVMRFEPGDAW